MFIDGKKFLSPTPAEPNRPPSLKQMKEDSHENSIDPVDPPSDDPNSYKMVIKNGVLMKKQKQRRYRTERPYGCNHCSARFTLR